MDPHGHVSVNRQVLTLPSCPAELADGSQQTTIMLQTQITSEELKIEAKASSHILVILNLLIRVV